MGAEAGSTPAAWLAEGPRPWPEVLRVFLQVAAEFRGAHEAGLVYGELRPSNVLLLPDGRARLPGLGRSRSMAEEHPATGDMTRTQAEPTSPILKCNADSRPPEPTDPTLRNGDERTTPPDDTAGDRPFVAIRASPADPGQSDANPRRKQRS